MYGLQSLQNVHSQNIEIIFFFQNLIFKQNVFFLFLLKKHFFFLFIFSKSVFLFLFTKSVVFYFILFINSFFSLASIMEPISLRIV